MGRQDSNGIDVRVLGDYGPFSEQGKSIGYQVRVAEQDFLLDCGAPLFQQVGGAGLARISGLIITHCHDDHKRWFTDLALYYRYFPGIGRPLPLLTSDAIRRELMRGAGPALNQSLSADSKRVVDLAFEDYIEHRPLGPLPRYRIVARDAADGSRRWGVHDEDGQPLPPWRAKVVVSRHTGKPRLLFRDPDTDEWVEPESYYPFSSPVFYQQGSGVQLLDGVRLYAINAPVWHGLPSIGVVFETAGEKLVFSSDTMHNLPLWESLYRERRQPKVSLRERSFLDAPILFGDINDYIERTWSPQRFEDAIHAFEGACVIHDVTGRFGVVHTEYHDLAQTVLDPERTLLTHAPDDFTTVGWRLVQAGKCYHFRGNGIYEVNGDGEILPVDADCYHKHGGRFFVGYRHPRGRHHVYCREGYHSLSDGPVDGWGEPEFRAVLFEDVAARYLPLLEGREQSYLEHPDGRVERIIHHDGGSRTEPVADLRPRRHSLAPEELAALGAMPAAPSESAASLAGENRLLRQSVTALRERLEAAVAGQQEAMQQAVSRLSQENTQLRDTITALRDELERRQTAAAHERQQAVSDTLAEIHVLRATIASLRETMEQQQREAEARAQAQEAGHRQGLAELQETIRQLRVRLEAGGS